MRNLSDIKRRLTEPKSWLYIILSVVLVIIFVLIIEYGEDKKVYDKKEQKPWENKEEMNHLRQISLAIIYDISLSVPTLLGDKFESALGDANEAVDKLIKPDKLNADIWRLANNPRYPNRKFDKIILIKMGEPNKESPFFAMEVVTLDELKQKLPSSKSDFQAKYTYISLAKAFAMEELESDLLESKREYDLYLLIISDFQESKNTRPSNSNWADLVMKFDGKYNDYKELTADWKKLNDFKIQLIKLERR